MPVADDDELQAIVFDLDGTLYQDDRLGEEVNQTACRYIAELLKITPDKAARLLQEVRDNLSGPGKTLSAAVTSLGGDLRELHERMNREVHPEGLLTLDPRVPELLKRLATRFQIHIYTNNNRKLSRRIMKELGVDGLFQRVFTIEEYWQPKPDPATLKEILESIGKKPSQTLFVGDRYGVDLALPESMGCAVFEAKTVEELLKLSELVKEKR